MGTNNATNYRPTQYNVQTGGASGTLNNVAPSSTSGVPVISQGASSQPIFGTAVVAGGGTGDTSFTAYAPVCGGTTTTAALQSASTGISTSGYVLTSNGASSLPTFQAGTGFTSINIQLFISSGTYTPTTNMLYCVAEGVGAGGGGGGCASTSSLQVSVGAGGASGGYCRSVYSASTIGSSQTITIGAAGAGGVGNNPGGAGGTTSFGSLFTATGGNGGAGGGAGVIVQQNGGSGGSGSGASVIFNGAPGGNGFGCVIASSQGANGGIGAASIFSGGQYAPGGNGGSTQIAGNNSAGSGGGGSGAVSLTGGTAANGGSGSAGIVIVTEYVWSVPASLPVWSDQSSNFNAVGGNGYFVTGTTTATLPSAPSEGATIMFAVDSTSVLTIKANTGQYIRLGTAISASAGTCANNARGDSIELVFRSSDSVWLAVPGTQGIWSIT